MALAETTKLLEMTSSATRRFMTCYELPPALIAIGALVVVIVLGLAMSLGAFLGTRAAMRRRS